MGPTPDPLIDPDLVNSVIPSCPAFHHLIHIRSVHLSNTSVNRAHLWETDLHRIRMRTSPQDTIMDFWTKCAQELPVSVFDPEEPVRNSHLPMVSLIEIGIEHQLGMMNRWGRC